MKQQALIFLAVLAFFKANSQTTMIKQIFRLLPADKVYDLSVATRDSMLQGKTYYPADNSSEEIAAFNYGSSETVKDYLYVSMSFETGQRGVSMTEIRSFKMLNGDNLVLVSQAGGVPLVVYDQGDLSVFVYNKNKKLVPYKKKILPVTDETTFMKPGIPDSIKQIILDNSNMTFDLSNEKLMQGLNSDYLLSNESLKKWLKGDHVYFDWVNDHFVMGKMEF